MNKKDLLAWLQTKLTAAETSLKARQQMKDSWRNGSAKEWKAVGCNLNRKQRQKLADTHQRIEGKIMNEVQMFRAVIDELQKSN